MTDETKQDEIKTGADLEIEQLKARLDAMESAHKVEVDELKKANRELWAKAHPADHVTETREADTPVPVWDDDKALKAFNDTLGIKEE